MKKGRNLSCFGYDDELMRENRLVFKEMAPEYGGEGDSPEGQDEKEGKIDALQSEINDLETHVLRDVFGWVPGVTSNQEILDKKEMLEKKVQEEKDKAEKEDQEKEKLEEAKKQEELEKKAAEALEAKRNAPMPKTPGEVAIKHETSGEFVRANTDTKLNTLLDQIGAGAVPKFLEIMDMSGEVFELEAMAGNFHYSGVIESLRKDIYKLLIVRDKEIADSPLINASPADFATVMSAIYAKSYADKMVNNLKVDGGFKYLEAFWEQKGSEVKGMPVSCVLTVGKGTSASTELAVPEDFKKLYDQWLPTHEESLKKKTEEEKAKADAEKPENVEKKQLESDAKVLMDKTKGSVMGVLLGFLGVKTEEDYQKLVKGEDMISSFLLTLFGYGEFLGAGAADPDEMMGGLGKLIPGLKPALNRMSKNNVKSPLYYKGAVYDDKGKYLEFYNSQPSEKFTGLINSPNTIDARTFRHGHMFGAAYKLGEGDNVPEELQVRLGAGSEIILPAGSGSVRINGEIVKLGKSPKVLNNEEAEGVFVFDAGTEIPANTIIKGPSVSFVLDGQEEEKAEEGEEKAEAGEEEVAEEGGEEKKAEAPEKTE